MVVRVSKVVKFRIWHLGVMWDVKEIDYDIEVYMLRKVTDKGTKKGDVVALSFKELEETPESRLLRSLNMYDRYGTEIYEYDILTDEGDDGDDFWNYGVVELDRDEYSYCIDWYTSEVCTGVGEIRFYSVAGNYFENKDLLG